MVRKTKVNQEPEELAEEAVGGIVVEPNMDPYPGEVLVPIEVMPPDERPKVDVHIDHLTLALTIGQVGAPIYREDIQERYEEHLKRIQGGK